MRRVLTTLAFLGALAMAPVRARAETLNCNEIASLPVTITTQGVYCLKQDLSTAITSGTAIWIAIGNVTLDCNGHKLGGLAGGTGTLAGGIGASDRQNIQVRNCNVRGFHHGVSLHNGGGHVIEDNRFDGITNTGVYVNGDGSAIRRNRIAVTGGSSAPITSGIRVQFDVDILDNTVSGVSSADGQSAFGIYSQWNAGTIARNRVRNIIGNPAHAPMGMFIYDMGSRASIEANEISNPGTNGHGLNCSSNDVAFANVINGYANGIPAGCDAGGNLVVLP